MDLTLTLAFVVAHPDDDAYGIAGTVALHAADPRFRFVLVHAGSRLQSSRRPSPRCSRRSSRR